MDNVRPSQNLIARFITPGTKHLTTRGEWFAWYTILVSLVIALLAFIVAPFAAVYWNNHPFPGFVVEQTLVVANIHGYDWSGLEQGIHYPQVVKAINSQPIRSLKEFSTALRELLAGQKIQVELLNQDKEATRSLYQDIEMMAFPKMDFFRLFWLPYFIGLVFLFIGIAIFLMRGYTQAGRSFTYFCVCASIAIVLTFDLSTSHLGTILWTFAISQIGGALIALSVVFPQNISPDWLRRGLRYLGYGISIGLSIWGLSQIYNYAHPWAYVYPWLYSYRFIAVSLLFFIAMIIYQAIKPSTLVARQQARIILWGVLIGFTPVGIWFGMQLIQAPYPWNPALYLPFLLIFPLSIGIAILRYRLWDIAIIIRRTVIYAIVMAILIFLYIILVFVFGVLLNAVTGQSQAASIFSTIVIIALFTPLRNRVQIAVDRRFNRQKYNAEKTINAFNDSLRNKVNPDQIQEELLWVIEQTMHPEFISIWINPEMSEKHPEGNLQELKGPDDTRH